MKINNEQFFAARNEERLEAIGFFHHPVDLERPDITKTYLRLWIKAQEKYTKAVNEIYIDADTEMRVENYSNHSAVGHRPVNQIAFVAYARPHLCHIRTFLNAINRDSEVSFRVVAFNGSDFWKQYGAVSHQIYGIIDGKAYFLFTYTGVDNHNSPIRASADCMNETQCVKAA